MRCTFDQHSIDFFERDTGVHIRLNREQQMRLQAESKVTLLVAQMSEVVHQLCPSSHDLFRYVEDHSGDFQPVSISLFVLNDDTWKLMEGKTVHPNRMLPMVTIPWFFWTPAEVTKTNPAGVRRFHSDPMRLSVDGEKCQMAIEGQGGDFCGLLEGRLVHKIAGMRPVLLPTTPGTRIKAPHYEAQTVRMTILAKESDYHLYPTPEKQLDYTFSENPKVFYEHGLRVDADGSSILLRVGNRTERVLRGEAKVYIGKPFDEGSGSTEKLAFHVWLTALAESIELMGGGPRPVRSF
jgi:hypothetical protein